jgi:hypothetical protein
MVQQGSQTREVRSRSGDGGDRVLGYMPMFYPGVTSIAAASTVSVAEESETTGLSVQTRLVPVSTIDVQMDAGGRELKDLVLQRIDPDELLPSAQSATARSGTTQLRLPSVPAGRFELLASAADPNAGPGLWSMLEVMTDGVTPLKLTMPLAPGSTVSGRVTFNGTSPPPTGLAIALVGADRATARRNAAAVPMSEAAAARFRFGSLAPGRYTFWSRHEGWGIQSIWAGSREITDEVLDLTSATTIDNLVVTLTDRAQAEVSGTISGADQSLIGATAAVFASDRRYWYLGSRRVRFVQSDAFGKYAVHGLPAGEYFVAAALSPGRAELAAVLDALSTQARRVTLSEGERRAVDLSARR